jgi:hypothetical protein
MTCVQRLWRFRSFSTLVGILIFTASTGSLAFPMATGMGAGRPDPNCESQLPGALNQDFRPLAEIAQATPERPVPGGVEQTGGDMLPVGTVSEFTNRAGRRVFTQSELTSAPLRAVGRLEVNLGNEVSTCTATMISPCVALTAAHCLRGYDQRAGGSFRFADGSQSARVTSTIVHPNYGRLQGLANGQVDIAMVRLDRPIGQGRALPVCFFDPSNVSEIPRLQAWVQDRVLAPGYHDDIRRPNGTIPLSGSSDASFNMVDIRGITHSADTASGGSGGPLLGPAVQRTNENGGRCIFGINVSTALTADRRQVQVSRLTSDTGSFASMPHYFRQQIEREVNSGSCPTSN